MLNGAAVSWHSKLQSVHALFSTEAEFIAASSVVQEVIYLRCLLAEIGFRQTSVSPHPSPDNETCIRWSRGAFGGSERAKHTISASILSTLPLSNAFLSL